MAKHSSNAEPNLTAGTANYQGRHRAEDGGRHETRNGDGKLVGWSVGREPKTPDTYNR